MSQRSKGRKPSALAGVSALASPAARKSAQEPTGESKEGAMPKESGTPPTASEAPKQTPQAAPKAPKKKKVSFYLSPEEEARAEAARIFTAGHTGLKTVTSYYEQAIAEFTRKLEAEYNDSKPFG